MGVDEIQYGRGHKYLTLVYQIEAGCVRLLWIGQERTKQSFARFFAMIGTQLCEKVEFVCSDMWKPYLEMIALHCPNALNILDRFHIVAKMNKAIDEVRADETRRMSREGYEPVLKKSRWCLLKRRENLTDKQRLRMRDLLQYNLRTVRAWLNIPRQSEQGFHGKKNTNSTAKLMPIPRQKEQGFHAIANRISGWRRRGSTVARSTVLSGVPNGKCQVDHAKNQGSAAAAFRV
ncbi:transposase [Caballeronia choica]|uniref:Transposase n=1 Tax=Caballeronia choica TaxID=326476 RepID=A0A158L702_9BURK|nr:transposase [Caballeronia choica]